MQERLRTYQAEHEHYKNRRMNNNKSNGFNTGRKSVNVIICNYWTMKLINMMRMNRIMMMKIKTIRIHTKMRPTRVTMRTRKKEMQQNNF